MYLLLPWIARTWFGIEAPEALDAFRLRAWVLGIALFLVGGLVLLVVLGILSGKSDDTKPDA